MTKEIKNKKIEAKCTEAELELVQRMASDNKMSIAEFVRARVFVDCASKYSPVEEIMIEYMTANAAFIQTEVREYPEEKVIQFKKKWDELKAKHGLKSISQ